MPQSSRTGLLALSLAATGVVYGDIGTSPLYAVRESLQPEHGVAVTPAAVLGVLSLVLWSLLLVISLKYLAFILRADNQGEGGVLALTSLITRRRPGATRRALVLLGLFATALLYGDGMITPAISVLSAVEGLAVATPALKPYVIPVTVAILVALFSVQRHGTARVGGVFGPVMVLWFVVLAALGLNQVLRAPYVLQAVSPLHALRFFHDHGMRSLAVLGSVFLVVTGGEALYADLGHFGRRPIRLVWFSLVLPALLLNYFGQGALVLRDASAAANPFFRMVPAGALFPLVALATMATVIASQALISGAYSLTRQAVQLGYLPRTTIIHTSAAHAGQIFVPSVNRALLFACVALVFGFRSSGNMAAAYGVAVTTTMAVTTALFLVYAREQLRWTAAGVLLLGGGLLAVDLAFLGANLLKVPHGGWFPLAMGAALFAVFIAWRRGRAALDEQLSARGIPPQLFVGDVRSESPRRVPGTAIYMSRDPASTPPALLHNLLHNRVLHERVVFLSVLTADVPAVPESGRVEVEALGAGIYRLMLHYGFMDRIDVPRALEAVRIGGRAIEPLDTSYFLGRESVVSANGRSRLPRWQLALFRVMSRNARDAASYFELPPNRVVELGAQVRL